MENENNKKPKRPQVNALYCSAEVADAVNNHPYFSGCITGADRAAKILESLDFAAEWKGSTEALNDLDQIRHDFDDLKNSYSEKENEINSLKNERDQLRADRDSLQADLDKVISERDTAESKTNERDNTIQQLRDNLEKLSGLPTWPEIRKTLEPIYADMMEEVAKELGHDNPLLMAVDIFVKYHVLRYTELPFQPFIPTNTLEEIINSNNPDLGGLRGLQKALR